MLQVDKKKKRSIPRLRLILLLCGLACAAGLGYAAVKLNQPAPFLSGTEVSGYTQLITYTQSQVTGVSVTLRGGEHWALIRQDGEMVLEGEPDFLLDSSMVDMVLDAACVVSYEEKLLEDPAEYSDHLADFGLEDPRCTAVFTYEDGRSATVYIGDRAADEDRGIYYMLVEGETGLFGLDLTTAQTLCLDKQALHAVEQPVIHADRIDRISITAGEQVTAWQLEGDILDADAVDRWQLISPMRYPAEGESLKSLRTNLSNLRMGTFICTATPESLTEYGFDTPRYILEVHMAAGTIGLVDDTGVYSPTDWPESTVTFRVGREKNDMVDYVLFNGCIYTVPHFTLNAIVGVRAIDTLTRYPVRVTLSNLSSLLVEQDGEGVLWQVTRTERTDAQGELLYDDDGNVLTDSSVTRNGEPYDWSLFETAYNRLLVADVSGTLPEGWQPEQEPWRSFTFTTRSGRVHKLSFVRFDALHDAVLSDGDAFFYVFRPSFSWDNTAGYVWEE